MATREDVARLAGTSTAVVSYVLNGGPRPVAAATRDRVLRAVDELGYRPNVLARALSARRSQTLGLIVPDICNPYFAELTRAVEDEAVARGYVLLVGNSAGSDAREADYTRILLERQVDAVLLISVRKTPDIDAFVRAGVPVVVLHQITDRSSASSLAIDDEAGAFAATDHLIEHGYRDLVFINGPADFAVARERQRGFDRATAGDAGVTAATVTADFSRAAAYQVARELLTREQRPRAILAASDEQAFGVLHAVYVAGLNVPADVAVMGFDGTSDAGYTNPPLSTVQQPIDEIAVQAIDLLISTRDDGNPVHSVLNHSLVLRQSCGCQG